MCREKAILEGLEEVINVVANSVETNGGERVSEADLLIPILSGGILHGCVGKF